MPNARRRAPSPRKAAARRPSPRRPRASGPPSAGGSASGPPPVLAPEPAADPKPGPDDTRAMSRHLIGLVTAMRLRMRAGLVERGHDLRPSTAQVVPNLPADGLRMSDLAARLRLTLQRAGQLVGELEEVGYLERIPDPDDGRARRVVFTRRGRRLLRDIDDITSETLALFAGKLGHERLGRLCGLLAELDVAVNGLDAPVRLLGGEYEGDSA